MAVVYEHIRKDTNEVFYVGVGKHESRAYWKHGRSNHWCNVVGKAGYVVNITHRDVSYEEALAIEKYLVSYYGREDFGLGSLVNKTDGGDGVENPSVRLTGELHPMYGKSHTEETKAKQSAAQRNRAPMSDLTRQKKRANMLGEKNPMYNKRAELSPSFGLVRSEETKAKLSIAKKGKPCFKMRGELNPNFGKCGGKNVSAKKVVDISTGVIYECAKYAAIEFGMAATTLRNMLNGYKKNRTTLKYL